MKAINVTEIRQINYQYHVQKVSVCRLLMYVGDGQIEEIHFRRGLCALLYPDNAADIVPGNSMGNVYIISFLPDILPGFLSAKKSGGSLLLADPSDSLIHFFISGWTLLGSCPDDDAAFCTVSALLRWQAAFVPAIQQEHASTSPKLLVEQAKTMIHNEFASDLTLQAVADQLFVNPCYLSTVFHQISGTTFRTYLKSVRLKHACRLLTQTNHLITDIAMQSGFNSTAYLISSFRKEYGVTPNAYRVMHNRH